MTLRQLPVIPTIIVFAAVATMIALGFWQLGRAEEKKALLAQYAAAVSSTETIAFPLDAEDAEAALFRQTTVTCDKVTDITARAGTSAKGAKGWAHYASCAIAGTDAVADVVIGWSRDPQSPAWDGGEVTGMIAPGPRIVANPPLAGLQQVAAPDPADVPNNHLAYTGQWFFFALTALVIYFLAIRKRIKEQA